ncbi:uncharacterized protein N7515_010107 [Penicillium bovifimosum]|uniref:Uncharacterized protein n=1 Tax=Penicillium bovifimosum TaxID=126998 RepID=A0A9W9GIZ6_9EURO|nr:uncharacterized protein N7515_010107 [Penicillium bovifimosum]KAJ5120719.1 hypothetical protein N7515_010107 [Penicillium bovifimosum]
MTHYAMPAPDESMFPQLSVNFDEFLQSQERSHTTATSSQQWREERWIPSTSEGGSGSVGAMMTEIGLAQRRLLDDEPSSGPQLQSTAALYTTDPIQSAPIPTVPSSHSYPYSGEERTGSSYPGAPNGTHSETNQSPLLPRQGIYDLTPPDTNNSMAPPPRSSLQQSSELFMEQQSTLANQPLDDYPQPRPQQPDPSSPHDTEPLSSIITLRYSGVKADTTAASLVSPQYSQSSAPDELALPAILPAIDAPAAKKKRPRSKQQSVPDSDEDDELANSRDHEFKPPGANGTADPSDTEEITENNTPVSSGTPDETDEENTEAAPKTKTTKTKPQDPKKNKAKKAKTTSTPNTAADEDDVIWLNTKPRDTQASSEKATPQPETPETRDREPIPLISENAPNTSKASTPEEKQQPANQEKPAPKKRSRKRKQPIETDTETPEIETPEPTKPPEPKVPAKLAVVIDNSPKSVPTNICDETGMQEQQGQQQAESATAPPVIPAATETMAPQTPSKPDAKAVNTPQGAGKGPDKHSPISARSAVPYRVGLSKRARIAPLLKMVRK